MDSVEFSKLLSPEMMGTIFRDYFEHHIAAYYMLKGLDFVSMNVSGVDKASIMYSVKLLNTEQIDRISTNLQRNSANLKVNDNKIIPEIFLSGDLLCITLHKELSEK